METRRACRCPPMETRAVLCKRRVEEAKDNTCGRAKAMPDGGARECERHSDDGACSRKRERSRLHSRPVSVSTSSCRRDVCHFFEEEMSTSSRDTLAYGDQHRASARRNATAGRRAGRQPVLRQHSYLQHPAGCSCGAADSSGNMHGRCPDLTLDRRHGSICKAGASMARDDSRQSGRQLAERELPEK